MRLAVPRLAMCLLFSVGLGCWSASASQAASLAGGSSSGPLAGPLVVSGVLDEGQQQAAEEARRSSPEAVHARDVSRTAYEHLSTEQATKIDREAFPSVVAEPAGGVAQLAAGLHITGYPTDNAVSVELGKGKYGVIESLEPLAIETAPGRRTPIDLGLKQEGAAFEAATADVHVRIPKRLGEGASLSGIGVSLTPVDASGVPLSGSEGSIDGASVVYANTARDMDTVVKPDTLGLSVETLLRSVESPEELFFRVGLPEGASLKDAKDGAGVNVFFAGRVIATVLAPSAHDAAGAPVPVSMSLSGDLLSITVGHRSGSYQYPLVVDPEVVDTAEPYTSSAWAFGTDNTRAFHKGSLDSTEECGRGCTRPIYALGIVGSWDHEEGKYAAREYAFLEYPTQGNSHIYGFSAKVQEGQAPEWLHGSLRIEDPGEHPEGSEVALPAPPAEQESTLCVVSCQPEAVTVANHHNAAIMEYAAFEGGNSYDGLGVWLWKAAVDIEQEEGPSAAIDTEPTIASEYAGTRKNALAPGVWVATKSAVSEDYVMGVKAFDPGIGVDNWQLSSPNAPGWGGEVRPSDEVVVQANECDDWGGQVCATQSPNLPLSISIEETHAWWENWNWGNLPEGEDTVDASVKDAVGLKSPVASATIKVDNAPPYGLTLTGLPSGNEISDAESQLKLKASATDGSGSTPSSGVASIALSIDGREVGTPNGSCTIAAGPCTATGEWAVDTEEYGAGKHTLTVTATDRAGNVASESYEITVHHATPVAMGPGSVNPVTGEFSLSATDVAVAAPGAALTVTRSYSSRHLAAGAEGPLGPQWSISAAAVQSIIKTAPGSLLLTGVGGQQTVFTSNGDGGYTPPSGDANLTLTERAYSGSTELLLSDGSAVSTFRHSSGGSSDVWLPAISEGAGGTNATSYAYQTVGGVTEPTEELAPVPAGVSCAPTLNKGCRALTFKYATSTTASGEDRSEWGSYQGHLEEVVLNAWEPKAGEKGEMVKKAVAKYEYDKEGRLRAEWNPEITPALKTTYGYDAEGHVTALTASGQQPSLFSYGTSEGDPKPGRLLSVTRPSAATPFGNGKVLENTALPALSSTKPAVGAELSVSSNGTWSNSPLAFSYQWEDCNASGGECVVIPGAVNQSYYPAASDEGHTLVAQVTASNSLGAVVAASTATGIVAFGKPTSNVPAPPNPGSSAVWTIDYHVPVSGNGAPYAMGAKEVEAWAQHDVPEEATAFFPPDEPEGWPAENYRRATIYYLDGRDRDVNVASPEGGIATEEYNETNDIVRSLSPDDRQAALNAGSKSVEVAQLLDTESTYSSEGTELLSTLSPQHNIELANGTQVQARASVHYLYDEGAPTEGGPYRLPTKVTTAALVDGEEKESHTTVNSYSGQDGLGWKLRMPTSTTTDPSGLHLVHSTVYERSTGNVIETRSPGSAAVQEQRYSLGFEFGREGSNEGQLDAPGGLAVDASGDVYVLDTENSRIEEFNREGQYLATIGTSGKGDGELKSPEGITIDSVGNIWVADTGNNRIEEFNAQDEYVTALGSKTTLDKPEGVTVDSHGNIWVANRAGNSVLEYTPHENEDGGHEYTLSKTLRTEGSGEDQLKKPHGVAVNAEGDVYISDTGQDQIVEYSATGVYLRTFGKKGKGDDELKNPAGVSVDSNGDVWVADEGNGRVEEFSATGAFLRTIGEKGIAEGQLTDPKDVAVDSEGDVWIANTGVSAHTGASEVSEWAADQSAQDTETIYYSAAWNPEHPGCGEHPEWAGLTCQTQPAKQPKDFLPRLQVSTYTYNLWDEPEKTTSQYGTSERTTTTGYDPAGRPTTTTTSSSTDTALPTVTDTYNDETGALQEQSTSEGKKITSVLNSLGELTSYTDADENTSTYSYDIDGRIEKADDGKGTQTYNYDPTTGELTKLEDSAAGTFTASYDPEGKMTSEGYPNGMSANYAYDSTGKAIALEYLKTTDCSSNCKWFTDTIVPTISGKWASQASTFASQAYTYDTDGRLTQVQETPAGQGCTTRIYAYEAETNRTSLTTRPPGSEGACATAGGTVETHSYDEANRLTDPGTSYDAFGNITALPAADAGGSELKSSYYSDNQLATQEQNHEAMRYNLDPAGRTRETISTGTTDSDIISHYAGAGDSPAWTVEIPSGHWTRNIPGINGALAAIQNSTGSTELQLPDLHGDIIATASMSETETKLHPTAETTEYGVPRAGSTPSKYTWLGADERPTELPTGIISMGARSYIPQLGRFLQEDPVEGGSANAYAYTYGDPVNSADPSGEYTATAEEWVYNSSGRIANEGAEAREAELAAIKAAEEQAAREAAERVAAEFAAAQAQAAAALRATGPQAAEGPQEPLGGSAGWACQYAAETGQADPGCGGGGGDMRWFITYSGDGCGDGGYCHGEWVRPTEKGHRHGEKLSGSPWEPVEAFCYLFPNPICNIGEKVQRTKH